MSDFASTITEMLNDAFKDMDSQGMYPQHDCRHCGKPLNADGGHPAELYAGTYTGLCYKCDAAPPFIVGVDSLDGARTVSHPSLDYYHRNRQLHTGYMDCPACNGYGATLDHVLPVDYVPLSGGVRNRYCAACTERHSNQPIRREAREFPEQLRKDFQGRYEARLRKLKLWTKVQKNKQSEEERALIETIRQEMTKEFQAEYKVLEAELLAKFEEARAANKPSITASHFELVGEMIHTYERDRIKV